MYWVQGFIIVIVLTNCWNNTKCLDDKPERQASNKLDENLRKALLSALNELEADDSLKAQRPLNENYQQIQSPVINNAAVQKAPASTISIITQPTSETLTEKPTVVFQKSQAIQHRPSFTFFPTVTRFNSSEQIIASASTNFVNSPKFQPLKNDEAETRNEPERHNKNLLFSAEKHRLTKPSIQVATEQPIITSTEENEAKVEDLQFFAAPLVAAFTVHHNERGLPEKVEPIFKIPGQTAVSTADLEKQRINLSEEKNRKELERKYKEEQLKLQQFLKQQEQARLQHDLEQKQKILEQQIRNLQLQQKQRDYLIQQQQIQEHNLLQQRQKFLEQQKVVKQQNHLVFQPNSFSHFNTPVNNNFIQNQASQNSFASSVSLQPSVTFRPSLQIDNTLALPTTIQQLPNKSATNFQQNFFQPIPVPVVQNFIEPPLFQPFSSQPLGKTHSDSFQPLTNFQNFNYREITTQAPQSTRVFRHESGTGNFVNQNYDKNNLFNSFVNPVQSSNSNRLFRSNAEAFSISPSISQDFTSLRTVRRPTFNNELNNLLYYSGITRGGGHSEDFNIVSKVLSLNHFGGDNFFGNSQVLENKVPPPKNYFVRS